MSGKKIFIYAGPGALKEGIKHLILTLNQAMACALPIKLLGTKELLESQWEEQAALFILPGGADMPYVRWLNGKGNEKIRSFVENGGSFLGICAGSYYAGSYVEFAMGSSIEVSGIRELSFFPGKVKGPIGKDFFYCSHKGATASTLLWQQLAPFSELKVYYNGGGYFENAEQEKNTTVLARYATSEPAIIECCVGNGLAILSGAHFEYDPSLLNPNDSYLANIIPHLNLFQTSRLLMAGHIFRRLGL